MIFYDTETCGFHGICVLIQWAEDDGPVNLHSVWTTPIKETLNLIEYIMSKEVCGFNLVFDHFHLAKLHTIFSLLKYTTSFELPENIIDEIAELEPNGRNGDCIKPKAACDIMLHARKGKYQSTMDRKNIYIRKIPAAICFEVRDTLEETIKLDDIYFARRKDKYALKWSIVDRDDCDDFKDIVLRFKASSALKNLAIHALKIPPSEILRFGDIEINKKYLPIEVGYAPFALAISNKANNWKAKIKKGSGWARGQTWPGVIHEHIVHWSEYPRARQYATDDVIYTRDLWKHLGSPEAGDDDSELACMVGAVRWKGFSVDIKGVQKLRNDAAKAAVAAPKAPEPARKYLTEVMDDIEKLVVDQSTKKIVLEEITTNKEWKNHPAVPRAQEILNARQAKSECDLFDKILIAGRLHASFSVIGALSGRMSGGGGGLNPQGIKRAEEIRSKFPLAFSDMILCGGDFKSFEVVLAIAYYGDTKLEKAVRSGKSIHGLFGVHVYPDMSYDEIIQDKKIYNRCKSAVFAMIYGGEAYTLKKRLGVNIEDAEKAYQNFLQEYPGIGKGRRKIFDLFCSMKQENGIGTAIKWNEPEESIASMFGFKRYFTLENQICKTLFNLARRPPKLWKLVTGTVTRRERKQTMSGATQSALYAAAFALQSSNMRAAGNHVIQSSGAQITKRVQRKIWDIQSSGIHKWNVIPINMHDEIMVPVVSDKVDAVQKIVNKTVKEFKEKVPLLELGWGTNLQTWADK